MARRIFVLDTSVLCCLLKVPGKETAGSNKEKWDHKRISVLVKEQTAAHSTFVLPLATIIETGNHIAQASTNRFLIANELAKLIAEAAKAESPWAAFTDQVELWGAERLMNLAKTWPELAKTCLSIGDATIRDVAEYYARAGFDVEIVTGDANLKAYQPSSPAQIPRRRR